MKRQNWFGMSPAQPARCQVVVDSRGERFLVWLERHNERIIAVILGLIVAAAILWAALFHVGRDNDLKLRLATAQLQVNACAGIRDLATQIDNTPSGSRTEAGRLLARGN
jgi:hypothetical protein